MLLSSTLAWLVDAAGESTSADRLLAELGERLVTDGVPLAGGALTMAMPHPLIARQTWLWRAEDGRVIEALGFVPGDLAAATGEPGDAGRLWLRDLVAGIVQEDRAGQKPDAPLLAWIGQRPFVDEDAEALRQAARFAAAPLALLASRATLKAALDAYLGRRSAARVLAGPLRRGLGETIQAALLYADLRGFTTLSENNPPSAVIAALDAWFDRMAGAIHAFGGEVLKFVGDGVLAIFPVDKETTRAACDAALRAVAAAQAGMAHLDRSRERQGLPALPFGAALHVGEIMWGNIGAAARLDFTAIGPAINLVSRLEGLCRPLDKAVLISGAFAAETDAKLVAIGVHELRGIASPCAVFTPSLS